MERHDLLPVRLGLQHHGGRASVTGSSQKFFDDKAAEPRPALIRGDRHPKDLGGRLVSRHDGAGRDDLAGTAHDQSSPVSVC